MSDLHDALQALLDLGVKSGQIVLEEGTTSEAARRILRRALDGGLSFLPDNPSVSIGGREIEIPVSELAALATPAIRAALDLLVKAIGPSSVEIELSDGVDVSWDLG